MDLLGFAFCCNPIALRQDAHPLHHHQHQQQLRQRQLTAGGPFGASSANGATGTHLALSALSSSSSRGQRSATGANQKRSHYVHAKQNNFSFNSADNNTNNNSSVRKQTDHNQSDHHNYSSSGTATSNLRLASSVLTLGSTPNVRLADITNGNDFDGRAASMHTLHRPNIQLIVAPPLTTGRRPGNSGRPDNRRRSVGLPPVGADVSSRSINYVDEQLGKQQQQQPDDEAAHLKRRRKRRQQEETHEPDVGRSGRQKRRRRRRKRGEASTPGALIKRAVDRQPSVAQVEFSATNNKARPSMGQIAGQQSNSSGSMRSSSRSSKQAKERPTWARTSLTARSHKDQTIKSNNTTDSTDTTAISLTTTTTTNGQVVVVAAASLAAPAANLQRLHSGELENQSAGMTDNDETDELDQAEAVDFRRYSDDLGQLDGHDNDYDDDGDGDWNEDEDADEDEDDEEDLSEQSSLDEYSDELYVQRDYEEDNDNLLFGSTDDFPARESEIGRCLAASGTSLVSLRMHKLNKQRARLHPPSQSGSFTGTGEVDPGGGVRPGCPARPADEKSERSELKQTTIST